MKKITLLLLSTASIIAFSFKGNAPAFEGKVTYEINIEGGNMPPEAMAMFAGSEMTVYVKGTKSRSDVQMGPQNTTSISDMQKGTSVTLMEVMGKKYKIVNDPAKDSKMPTPEVKYSEDTKTIAGYKCKKAEITYKDETGNTTVTNLWYTEEISNYMGTSAKSAMFKGIKGMPLEYEVNADRGMKMKMVAKTITKESVPDSKFEISGDYKETTQEDLQKEMMKAYQGGGK